MSKISRRKFTSEFKSKVYLEAIKEQQTIEALSKKHELHSTQINTWEKEFLEKVPSAFGKGNSAPTDGSDKEQLIQLLYAQIGELKVANDFFKKIAVKPLSDRRAMIEKEEAQLSMVKQCDLLAVSRCGLYYEPVAESTENLAVMRVLDEKYLSTPFYGVERLLVLLVALGYRINRKRVHRLMKLVGWRTLYCMPRTTKADLAAYKYPYLLKGLKIDGRNQVWEIDITYVPMKHGFIYLCAVINVYSRYVVGWGISNTMTAEWCTEILKQAIEQHGKPEIMNGDQGSQFTSEAYIGLLKKEEIQISMDGKGRALDNIFIERLWRIVKYEYIYLYVYEDGLSLYKGQQTCFTFYNGERRHQSLGDVKPVSAYQKAAA